MKIQNQLGYIKGITFAPFHKRGSLSTQTARDSFDYMIEHTAADFVILAPVGLQDHAHSEEICYTSSATFSDEELINMIRYAKCSWINGFAMWEWAPVLPSRSTAARDTSYEICNKPVQEVIKDSYGRDKRK